MASLHRGAVALVSCQCDNCTSLGDPFDGGFGVGGPGERLGVVVSGADVVDRGLFQRGDAGEHAATKSLLRQVREYPLDLVFRRVVLEGVRWAWFS